MTVPDLARIGCCVPGCRRTSLNRANWVEWICQRHWSAVPKRMRHAYTVAQRRKRPPTAINRIWRRCKGVALNEAFMGFPNG